MITNGVTCDVCGKSIGQRGGGYVDLHHYDTVRMVVATYPPQCPGTYDICAGCRDALSAWLDERRKEACE